MVTTAFPAAGIGEASSYRPVYGPGEAGPPTTLNIPYNKQGEMERIRKQLALVAQGLSLSYIQGSARQSLVENQANLQAELAGLQGGGNQAQTLEQEALSSSPSNWKGGIVQRAPNQGATWDIARREDPNLSATWDIARREDPNLSDVARPEGGVDPVAQPQPGAQPTKSATPPYPDPDWSTQPPGIPENMPRWDPWTGTWVEPGQWTNPPFGQPIAQPQPGAQPVARPADYNWAVGRDQQPGNMPIRGDGGPVAPGAGPEGWGSTVRPEGVPLPEGIVPDVPPKEPLPLEVPAQTLRSGGQVIQPVGGVSTHSQDQPAGQGAGQRPGGTPGVSPSAEPDYGAQLAPYLETGAPAPATAPAGTAGQPAAAVAPAGTTAQGFSPQTATQQGATAKVSNPQYPWDYNWPEDAYWYQDPQGNYNAISAAELDRRRAANPEPFSPTDTRANLSYQGTDYYLMNAAISAAPAATPTPAPTPAAPQVDQAELAQLQGLEDTYEDMLTQHGDDPNSLVNQEYQRRLDEVQSQIAEIQRQAQEAQIRADMGPGYTEAQAGSVTGALARLNPDSWESDIFQAMLQDREREAAAMGEEQARAQQGTAIVAQGVAGAGEEARTGAQTAAERGMATSAQLHGAEATELQGLRDLSGALIDPVATRREAAITDVERRGALALNEYRDTTAQLVQTQAVAVQSNMQSQIDDIRAQARARGLDPDQDPATRQLESQARMNASGQIGNIATSVRADYNQTRAALRNSYDSAATAIRQSYDQMLGQREVTVTEMRQQIADMQQGIDRSRMAYELSLDQMELSTSLSADQLRMAGATTLASQLMNEFSWFSPVADIVALAALAEQSGAGIPAEWDTDAITGQSYMVTGLGTRIPVDYEGMMPDFMPAGPQMETVAQTLAAGVASSPARQGATKLAPIYETPARSSPAGSTQYPLANTWANTASNYAAYMKELESARTVGRGITGGLAG